MAVCALLGMVSYPIERAITGYRSARLREAATFHSRLEAKYREWANVAKKFERYETARRKDLGHKTPSDSEWPERWKEQSLKAARLAEWHAKERSKYEMKEPPRGDPSRSVELEKSPPRP
jgi:hypothetical protein